MKYYILSILTILTFSALAQQEIKIEDIAAPVPKP